uniref:Thyroid hormone receptor-associated protein 3-like n=1 Tax=Salmo trutta TaxID=8032 RepID=A0A674AUN9_SALTR
MSRPRSRSPHYSHRGSPRRQDVRRFPWDDPDFDPQQVLADLGRLPWEENRNPGESHEDQWVRFMDEIHPDGHRRPMTRGSLRPKGHRRPISPGPHRPDQHLPPEDFRHRRTPPPPHELGYAERRRLSPHDGGGGGRGRVKEEFQRCEGKLPPSPQRLPRERLPSLAPQHTHYSPSHHQRAPSAGWRREERNQSQGRSRDRSPRERVQGGGKWERGEGGDSPSSYRDRKRDDMQREWSTISDRNRRETVEPVNPGQLCYSSDRQLSLDLVNVGRQHLDFLPMLEHSGTYRESTMHSGTFAQEIITLVHQVKEHYFRGDSVTLTERFCGAQNGGLPEEEQEEERPTLNRRFNMSLSEPDMEPLFSKVGRMQKQQQAVSDPGDLRHDLERRRQERLEGVKVTIPGGRLSQRPLVVGSVHHEEYGSEEEEVQEEEEGFSSGWPGLPQRGGRWPGEMRRGGIVRQNMGGQRRNNRSPNLPGNHPGPMRQQNRNINGANW